MFFDYYYLVLVLPAVIFAMWASSRVNGTFRKYSQQRSRRRLTGADAARMVLDANGLRNVRIERIGGNLTDHYDPRDNTIYLSEPVYNSDTVAAVGVAAHEAGHAVQYAVGYGPVRVRTAIIPVTQFGSQFAFVALVLGLVLYIQPIFAIGIVLFALTTIFQLVTLPVEFDASARAIGTIEGGGLLDEEEQRGAKKVLRSAALTYVAALLMSLVQLLRYLLIFAGRDSRRR